MDRIDNDLTAWKNKKNVSKSAKNGAKEKKEKEQREKVISEIIAKSRRSLGYGALTGKELDQWVDDWSEVCSVIPTEMLNDCYVRAMQAHKDGPFAAYQIVSGYEILLDEESERLSRDIASEERKVRERRAGDIPMPPEIKVAINQLLDRWDMNLKRRPNDPPLDPFEIEIPLSAPSAVVCNSCFGSGWSVIKRTDPVSGLPGSATFPCICELGRKYDRSYRAAIEAE